MVRSPRISSFISLLLLAAAGCTSATVDAPPSVDRGRSPLVADFDLASQESGVPADLLMALGYVESRFSQRRGQPSVLKGYGVMHLRAGSTLDEAAKISGFTQESLKHEARINIRGAAAVLAQLARASGEAPRNFAQWRPALEQYSGLAELAPMYADEIYAVLSAGAKGVDEQGRSLLVPAHPEAHLAIAGDGLGQLGFEARPDYSSATWVGPSPNYSSRNSTPVDLVIVHTCEGGFSGCVSWLLNDDADVSAHYVVSSTGTVNQLVEEYLKAWHVGCVNARSVGIEHEGYLDDPSRWFTDEMYCQSAKLVRSICDRNAFPCDRAHVIGHVDANEQYCGPGHTDPGPGWNWTKFMDFVQNGCGGSTGTGRLLGFVYRNPDNTSASRIAGATVSLNSGETATTDATGLYSFSLAPGTYTLTVAATGYQSSTVTRAVNAGGDTWASIGLIGSSSQPTGQYYGSVYEMNPANPADMSTKLPGATVTLDTGATTTSRAGDAVFKFDGVPAGPHTATATLAGFKTNSSTKTVEACAEPGTCATWASIGLTRDGGTPVGAPKVTLTTPGDGANVEEAYVDVKGQVDNATDVRTVKVEWAGQSLDAPLGAGASFNAPVKVPPGDTLIKVTATNGGGSGSASVTVHFKPGVCGFVFEDGEEGESSRIGGATVELVPGNDLCASPAASTSSASPDGTWCLDAAPGDYFLRVKAADHLTSTEGYTVSGERRGSDKTGLARGSPEPYIALTEPELAEDGKLHVTGATTGFTGTVQGLMGASVTVNGKAIDVFESVFTVQDLALGEGETTVTIVATGACGETVSLELIVVRDGSAAPEPDAGSPPNGNPKRDESGACGCAAGGEGMAMIGLASLAALLRRRRR